MNVRALIFNLTAAAFMLCPAVAKAQASAKASGLSVTTPETVDSLTASSTPMATDKQEADDNPAYTERMQKRQNFFLKMIPEVLTLQYAGGIGMLSAGVGWAYGPSDNWQTDLLIGFIPHRYYHPNYWTLTLRELYSPWRIHIGSDWSVRPVFFSLGINSILHNEFWSKQPTRYPSGYYIFPSKIRLRIGIGQRISFTIPRPRRHLGRKISLYWELSTCDLYIRQKIKSSAVPFHSILSLAIGASYTI